MRLNQIGCDAQRAETPAKDDDEDEDDDADGACQ